MPEKLLDEFLKHYGVKGMKWGKSRASVPGQKSRKELRSLDKVERKKDRAEATAKYKKDTADRDASLEKARTDLPQKQKQLYEANQKYKQEKKVIGKVAARKALKPYEDEFMSTLTKAWESTSSQEKKKVDAQIALASTRLIKDILS